MVGLFSLFIKDSSQLEEALLEDGNVYIIAG
jgi:hypothetical protein